MPNILKTVLSQTRVPWASVRAASRCRSGWPVALPFKCRTDIESKRNPSKPIRLRRPQSSDTVAKIKSTQRISWLPKMRQKRQDPDRKNRVAQNSLSKAGKTKTAAISQALASMLNQSMRTKAHRPLTLTTKSILKQRSLFLRLSKAVNQLEGFPKTLSSC